MTRRIGYARVSTRDQNPELQEQALREANCNEIHTEKKSSVLERPVFENLLASLDTGDTLVFWKIDRIARSVRHLLSIVDDFAVRGIHFHCLDFNIDTGTAQGKLVLTMMGAVSEFERNINLERTNAGLDVARANGVILGPSRKLSAEAIIDIQRCARDGIETNKQLAKRYGVHRNTISRVINCHRIPFSNMPAVYNMPDGTQK